MPEGFGKNLREFAEEENSKVDYEALRKRILEEHEKESTKKQSVFNGAQFRKWGALAACLLLCMAAGTLLLRGGGKFSSPASEAPAAEAPTPAAAAALTDTAAPFGADQSNSAAMEEYAVEESAVEEPMLAMMADSEPGKGREAEAPAALSGAAVYDPFTILVNRQNPLAADHVPSSLIDIATLEIDALTLKNDSIQGDETASWALKRMIEAARDDGVTGFYLASVYRSYDHQADIWANKIAHDPDYGKNGEPVASMPPGESEHQTGLAFDITCLAHPSMSRGYADTEQAKWLAEHCGEYGFILRYPEGKEEITGVIYEPWHFRYVGEGLSADMMSSGLALEEFLGHTNQ